MLPVKRFFKNGGKSMNDFKNDLQKLNVSKFKASEMTPWNAQSDQSARLCFFFNCFNCFRCFNCSNCFNCQNCFNCHNCHNCHNCQNCHHCHNCHRGGR
ncbi:MAG: heterocycloanthracin/sonorensin family bacteriocin [Bacillota bacterium]